MTTAQALIVARRENVPLKLPRNTGVSGPHIPGFLDAKHHDELSDKLGCPYAMPSWDDPCEVEAMRLWLVRLEMTEKQYRQWTNTSIADFCALNSTWPLRSWIGTVLKLKDEKGTKP